MTIKISRMPLGILTIAAGLAAFSPATAQQVTLTSADGTVNMTGTFKEFRDNNYVISTALGDMRVSANRVSCFGEACPTFEDVKADTIIGGSDTVGLALMPLLLEGYAGSIGAAADMTQTGNGSDLVAQLIADEGFGDDLNAILVNSTTSGRGFDDLLNKEIEVSMASRRIRPEEARELRAAGAGNMINPAQEHIIAVDSIVLITHPDNRISTLTSEQLRGIYSGQITNWSEVGGNDLEITVVGRPEGSGTRDVFESRIFGDAEATLAENAVVIDTNDDATTFVSDNIGAVAFVGYAFQRDTNPVTIVNDCGIAVEPSAFSARTEEYALQRRLYLYTREDTLSDEGRQLVNFASSDAADSVIGKSGFIGFAVDRQSMSLESPRARALLDPSVNNYEAGFMRNMLAVMADHDRLSTTFRFRTGSSRLDERGQIDMERLIAYLANQPQGTEIVMVGFTDSVGEFAGNLNLSAQRAGLVAQELLSAGADRLDNVTVTSMGFGEISPSGCNDTEEGRRINRRVEVWIKSPA